MYFMLCVTVNSFNVVDNIEITLSVNELINIAQIKDVNGYKTVWI